MNDSGLNTVICMKASWGDLDWKESGVVAASMQAFGLLNCFARAIESTCCRCSIADKLTIFSVVALNFERQHQRFAIN